MKKFILILLALTMVISCFSACKKQDEQQNGDTPEEEAELFFDLLKGDGELCKIVYSNTATVEETSAVKQIEMTFSEVLGKKPEAVKYGDLAETHGAIILVGNTGHEKSTAVAGEMLYLDYGFKVCENNILCISAPLGSNVIRASTLFCDALKKAGTVLEERPDGAGKLSGKFLSSKSEASVKGDYIFESLTVNSVGIENFTITYNSEFKGNAQSIQSSIAYATGRLLEMKMSSFGEAEYEIIVGDPGRAKTNKYFSDSRYKDFEKYEMTVSEKKIIFSATNKMSMDDLCDSFGRQVLVKNDSGKLDITDAISLSGNISSKNASLKIKSRAENTEVRIACNNVYFYSENCAPMAERRYTMCDSLYFMDADVILLQEVSTKWHTNMDPLMEEMGYTIVPTRLNEGAVINASGVSTQTNYTPIWYRADKLELMDYGYDQFETVKRKPDSNHTTSKSFTWALFKTKSTGEQFACISTHFTWAPETFVPKPVELRKMDAQEILDAIETIQTKYAQVPCIVMGDLNSTPTTPAYKLLAESLADARNTAKSKFNTDSATNHTVGSVPTGKTPIDHTFYTEGKIDPLQYQYVINDLSINATDHIPLLFDIALN